jgi:hypothetical protein
MILHVTDAQYVDEYKVHVWFNDGTDAEIDLSASLTGPIFEPLRDVEFFKSFTLEGHTLSWPNGANFAPEYLRSLVTSRTHA